MTTNRLPRTPFAVAIATSTLLVLSAPFVGQIRGVIRREFPGHFVLIIGGLVALGLAVALAAAVWRIRDRRPARYGAIALAVLIAVVYSVASATPFPESNAVERFHFLQYGLITFLFYRAWRPLEDAAVLLLPLLAGLIVGTAEEWLQWFIPNRVGEIRDVVLNLVAIVSGLLFSVGVDPPRQRPVAVAPGSRPRIARLSLAALFTLAAFFHVVHLGYQVSDAEIGTFSSRYPGERILELQADRAARWAAAPPPTSVVRLSREDQYLTEGIQHVRERNRLWTAGDIRGAWLENLILERYFAPVLDTPTHEGAGHRWPPEQHADAQRRGAGFHGPRVAASDGSGLRTFVSRAYPYKIVPWPKLAFWAAVVLLAGGVMAIGRATPGPEASAGSSSG